MEITEESNIAKLHRVRRNILLLLLHSNATPFQWNSKGFKCFYCHKDLPDVDIVRHTKHKHSNVNIETFITKLISKDIPIKLDVTDLACNACMEPLNSFEDLIDHLNVIHAEQYDGKLVSALPFKITRGNVSCVLCENQYDNFTTIVNHMYKSHVEHSFVCQICGASFLDQIRMTRHFKNCHIGLKCVMCGKLFAGTHKLDRHKELVHGRVKSHNCNLCNLSFINDYQVKVHMGKAHNVEKYKIRCDLCPKVCSTKGALVLHLKSVHTEPTYECDLCDYKASIKWMIKLHRRKHLGERDYECSVCKKRFGRSSNLRAHMRVHTGNFGRVCRVCRQGFADLEELKRHFLMGHSESTDEQNDEIPGADVELE